MATTTSATSGTLASEKLGSNEELNCENAMERDASPFATHDPILCGNIQEGNNWAIP
jgi:hypothetical protein